MGVVIGKPSMFFNKSALCFNINHTQVRLNHNVRHSRIFSWIGEQQFQGLSRKNLLDPGFGLLAAQCVYHVEGAFLVL